MSQTPLPPSTQAAATRGNFLMALLVILVPMLILFSRSFDPKLVVFANDGPLGYTSAQCCSVPEIFTGFWQDLFWLGAEQPSASPTISGGLDLAFGPLICAKIYAPISMVILGLCAWLFFRELGLHWAACLLGGLAASLNSDIFSNACWGLPTRALALASTFLGLAALYSGLRSRSLLKGILAGFAVGMSVMEGFDVGAIFSLYVSAFAVFIWFHQPGPVGLRLARGAGIVFVMALFAAIIAAQTVNTLVGTQLKGVAGMQQDTSTRLERWHETTQWSLPKLETIRVVIPGIFGYRMDTPDGGNYWGSVGQTPGYEETRRGIARYSGAGEYAGVLVVLLALWAVVQSFRGAHSPFSPSEKRLVWFWLAVAVLSLLFAFGRHAPFYQLIYALPYFSTIRNPIKFMHPCHMGLLVLFACGVNDLWRRYIAEAPAQAATFKSQFQRWWPKAPAFEKKFTYGLVGGLLGCLLGWLIYFGSLKEIIQFLVNNGFGQKDSSGAVREELAQSIARFSLMEYAWFLVFLLLSAGSLVLILSRAFAGARARWALVLLGVILAWDLGRANLPWIQYYNYQERLAAHPILDLLRQKPYENRVTVLPFQVNQQLSVLQNLYGVEWLQHQFPYYNIQALDVPQEPRKSLEKIAYEKAVLHDPVRYWQLTNTRFFLGLNGLEQILNQQLDPELKRFRAHTLFSLSQTSAEAPVQSQLTTNGPFALLEFTGALPRASLYTRWQVETNLEAALTLLTNRVFNPAESVIVSTPLPAGVPPAPTNAASSPVRFASYRPKQYVLEAKAEAPSILLINDKFHPHWKVWVDGQPDTLLRCNYMTRGVFLKPGQHRVELRFDPPSTALRVSLAALAGALLLCGWVAFVPAQPKTAPKGTV